jgi:hypothetical protein
MLFISCEKEKEILPVTLTVKEVKMNFGSSGVSLKSVKVINEKGSEVVFSDNVNNWFENSTLETMTLPAGTSISFGDFNLLTKARFDFKVDGKNYAIGVGPESKFVVMKTNTGKYNLLPEETVKLSPP